MYSSYTAASFARKHDLADKHGVNLEGALTWAFEFEDQPYFAGFRSLATNGIDKPVLNVFRMFSQMSGERLAVESDHAVPLDCDAHATASASQPDVSALASLDNNKLCVLVWHYHDDDVPGPAADVELTLDRPAACSAARARLAHFRIDEDHSNAFTAWKRMGSPQQPNGRSSTPNSKRPVNSPHSTTRCPSASRALRPGCACSFRGKRCLSSFWIGRSREKRTIWPAIGTTFNSDPKRQNHEHNNLSIVFTGDCDWRFARESHRWRPGEVRHVGRSAAEHHSVSRR